ncbi:uncharacterized protein [Watersipora subatra]|uniref:uncharacterized protein n=1 Tax=Watersipora subatra TaxID=2589382 RepID=UPI00355C0A41
MESESDDDALSFNADLITEQQEMSTSDSQDLFAQETQPVSNSDATSRPFVESQSEDNDMLFEMLTQPNSEMICKAKANALSSSAAEDCSGVVDGSEEDATDDGLVNRKPAEICYRGVGESPFYRTCSMVVGC